MAPLTIVPAHRLARVLISCLLLGWLIACGQPPAPRDADSTGTSAGGAAEVRPALLPSPTAAVPDAAYTEEDRVLLEALRRDLAQPELSAETRRMLDDKLRFLEREVAERATAIAAPPVAAPDPDPTDGPLPTPFAPSMTVVPNAGVIIDDGDYPGRGHLSQNKWYIDRGDQWLLVYAGAGTLRDEIPDADQGSLIVEVRQGPEADPHEKPIVAHEVYLTPARAGAIRIVGVQVHADAIRLTLQARDGGTMRFNVTTRTWESLPETPAATPPAATTTPTASADCAIYPIALDAASVRDVAPGTVLPALTVGTTRGNAGWLAWAGDPSSLAFIDALTPPGTSTLYRNPQDPTDRTLSPGDWVWGRPGIGNSQSVRDALEGLKGRTITVLLWDATTGEGSRLAYHINGRAQVQLVDYQLPDHNRLTLRYLGTSACA